ncbi:biotin--[acetyl-CoA-carboxylase] ligase [Candidatus Woesearchaeota archaeon]|nr:biotin--[acetyl-CoA-carboxylase] ligase [Candidatus Woesearchaeota archaeon]
MPPYKIYRFKSLTSTQDKAKEFAKKGLSDIIIVAGIQTKGRGRFKRKWHSGKNGLWMSILLKPKNIRNLQYLTFAASIAVAKSIKKIAKIDAKIKWPNDVHYKGRKLCGILTEGIFGKENHVVVGIGLNANQIKFPQEIKNIAASLKIIKKKTIDMEKLMKTIIDGFFKIYCSQYDKNKFQNILKIWGNYCDTIGKGVVVITKTRKLRGEAIGVDENCNLLLKAKNKIIKIVEGDLNVRY